MNITSNHITGFVVGVGAAALGLYVYKRNQDQVDSFLRRHGIDLPAPTGSKRPDDMTLEELVAEKERLEDLVAEREMALKEMQTEPAPGA